MFTNGSIRAAPDRREVADSMRRQAEYFFTTHRLCCSESVLLVLNHGFNGELPVETALLLGSGFCKGLGGAGCLCGALSAAVMALGLFLGSCRSGEEKKEYRRIVKKMHAGFRNQFGATCCRVLSKDVRHDRKAHFDNCKRLSGGGAALAAELLLETRPDLGRDIRLDFLYGNYEQLEKAVKELRGWEAVKK